jgi:hypothetical protein
MGDSRIRPTYLPSPVGRDIDLRYSHPSRSIARRLPNTIYSI